RFGTNLISLSTTGNNQLLFTGSQTYNAVTAGTAGSVKLLSQGSTASINFGALTQTIQSGAALQISSPSLTFGVGGAVTAAPSSSSISLDPGTASGLSITLPTNGGTASKIDAGTSGS